MVAKTKYTMQDTNSKIRQATGREGKKMYQVNAKGYSAAYYKSRAEADTLAEKLAALNIPHSIRNIDYWHMIAKCAK